MRFWRSFVLLAPALVLLAAPARAQQRADSIKVDAPVRVDQPVNVAPVKAPALPKEKHSPVPERRAWMFGLNYGWAGVRFVGTWQTLAGELRSDTPIENPVLVYGHPNWTDTRIESATAVQFRLGYAINPQFMIGFERAQWFKDFGDYSWRFSTSTLSATWYPGASHLFVRGGAGVSSMNEKIPGTGPLFLAFADRGLGIEGAVGYEWDIWKRATIAPEVSVRGMQFGDQVRAQMGAASLGLNWWF